MSEILLRVRVILLETDLDEVIGLAMSLGAQGVEVCDSETHGLEAGSAWVHAWHGPSESPDELLNAYRTAVGPDRDVSLVREMSGWRDGLKPAPPRALGNRFVVSEEGDPLDDRIPLRITAGLGFGDGVHPTTQCCAFLIEGAMSTMGLKTVLDVGTGSGVLALIAAHLGAEGVFATDIDSVARDGAQGNIDRNGFEERVMVSSMIPEDLQADLVVANLYLGSLPGLIPCLVAATAAHGTCILSGFTVEGEALIDQLMGDHGFEVCERSERSSWVALRFERA